MTSSKEEEKQLIQKSSEKLITCKDALEMLRLKCLERGAKGIRGLARYLLSSLYIVNNVSYLIKDLFLKYH